MTDATEEKWQQIAIEIGDSVFRLVNTAETVGGEDETGYVLLFFNTQGHEGKSTLVSSATNRADVNKRAHNPQREL